MQPNKKGLTDTQIKEITENWRNFHDELSILATTALDEETIARLQTRYNLANEKPLIDTPRLAKYLKCSPLEKKGKYLRYPNSYTLPPLSQGHETAKGIFRLNVLPGPKGAEEEEAEKLYARRNNTSII